MLIKLKNKKAMSISIVLLVLATLVLSSFALFTFYTREESIQEKIYTARFLENIYAREEQINFYINEIMEEAVENSETEGDLIINFLAELSEYKEDGKFILPELQQVQEQINEDNLEVENGKATAEFEITLKDEREIFSAVYTYTKKFEKEI